MAAGLSINYLGLRLVPDRGPAGRRGLRGARRPEPRLLRRFLLLVGVFYRPLEKIGAVIETYPKGVAGFRRYQELLSTVPDITDRPDAVEAPSLHGDIGFEGVGFGYGAASGLHRARPVDRGGRDGRLRRPLRRRQDDPLCPAAALLRSRRRTDHHRRHGHSPVLRSIPCAAGSASCSRTCSSSPGRSAKTSPTVASMRPRPRSPKPLARPPPRIAHR